MQGTVDAPITIRGPASGDPAVLEGESCCNTIELERAAHLVIEHLHLDGLGLSDPSAVYAGDVSHDIVLQDLLIENYDGSRNTVGISTKADAWNWTVRRNVIRDTGTGMYFGLPDNANFNGEAAFAGGLIERNLVTDTIGYNIQIKDQIEAHPPEAAGASRTTIIRDNVFSKSPDNSDGGGARPNLLVGHWPLSGDGADDYYVIEGNFFYGNPTEALFQGDGNIVFYNNLMVIDRPGGDAIAIFPTGQAQQRLEIFHNTILADDRGIRVSGSDASYVQRIEANAVFADRPIQGPGQADNVTDARSAADDYLAAPDAALGSLSLFPEDGALTRSALASDRYSGFPGSEADFEGAARDGTVRGAYTDAGGAAAWTLALAIKPASPGNAAGGGGGGSDGTGNEGSGGNSSGGGVASLAGLGGLLVLAGLRAGTRPRARRALPRCAVFPVQRGKRYPRAL